MPLLLIPGSSPPQAVPAILLSRLVGATAGSLIAAPLAAMTVKKVKSQQLTYIIGAVTIMLGIHALLKTFIL